MIQKRTLLTAVKILFILSVQPLIAQNPSFDWARQMGSISNDYGISLVIDKNENSYTTGSFRGTVDFDPGIGTNILSTSPFGIPDIFVQKLDVNGNLLWAKRMGGTSYDAGSSIAVDDFGNVFVTGIFFGTADFDPGSGMAILSCRELLLN
jgi:hypothetical protein